MYGLATRCIRIRDFVVWGLNMFWCRSFFGVVVLVALFVSQSAFAAYFQGLGDLPGGLGSGASLISADGSVVVGSSLTEDVPGYGWAVETFRWTESEGMVALLGFHRDNWYDAPCVTFCGLLPKAVSADGSILVGMHGLANRNEAFRWTASDGAVDLGYLPGGDGQDSVALGISSDGATVVGGSDSALGYQAFRWTSGGGMVGLGDLAGGDFQSGARDVSADGSVVVGSSVGALGNEAFRWTSGGGMVGLGDLAGGSFSSGAQSVSADGAVVVGSGVSASGNEAFRWTAAGGMVGLGDLPGGSFSSFATDVSADGSVVVGASNAASGNEAFFWTEALGMVSLRDYLIDLGLDLTGWTLSSAQAISADGYTIVGTGTNPSGQSEAWIANVNPVPEPSAALLVGVGLIGLVLQRRRKDV